jgi:hypothetical protein
MAARRGVTAAQQPKLRVSFSMREVARLSGMSYWTLRHWSRKGWVRKGSDETFSAWTVVALSILSATNRGRGQGAYLGDVAVRRAMESVADLDDAILLREADQDPYVAEAVAAIASAALPDVDRLSPEVYESLARVLAALDRKVRVLRNRPARRVPGVG